MTTSSHVTPEKKQQVSPPCDCLRWLGWLVAACLAAVCVYLYGTRNQARAEAEIRRIETELAKTQAEELRQQLEAERILGAHERAASGK